MGRPSSRSCSEKKEAEGGGRRGGGGGGGGSPRLSPTSAAPSCRWRQRSGRRGGQRRRRATRIARRRPAQPKSRAAGGTLWQCSAPRQSFIESTSAGVEHVLRRCRSTRGAMESRTTAPAMPPTPFAPSIVPSSRARSRQAAGGDATTFAMPVAATFALRRRRYLLIPGTRGSHSSNPTLSDIGRDGTRGIDTGGYDRV